jgi:(R)-2-hydroxyacyl-CoA dehydratese activating ATPase
MICAGIDAGSRAIKVVLFDTAGARLLAAVIADQGVEQPRLAAALFERALQEAALDRSQVAGVVATGYGRSAVAFADTTITEITCHARGVHQLAPAARTLVEIGGQDSKVIFLDGGGRVRDFAMNDRCAAGSGRFLEVVAGRLGVDLAGLGELSQGSTQPAIISSMCVVFAETEIVGLLAAGAAPADLAAGVQSSIAARVAAMMGRSLEPPVYFTGGVALQEGMVHSLGQALNSPVQVAPMPQFTGALGAAILAAGLATKRP